nr:immunoglobulin light chain junction region [Macaca mulatta]MOY15364.1 immunoglobulin light chain junction region [Macaca mulatta]MOY16678.1 immunoglobulin light chain junction region [Macaca mulatta]MOY16886.1 immunoglobulin light chain junction region [Macaca mulatta]
DYYCCSYVITSVFVF